MVVNNLLLSFRSYTYTAPVLSIDLSVFLLAPGAPTNNLD
jgi:hypothetical protein